MTQPFRGDPNHAWNTEESIANFLIAWRSMNDNDTHPRCRHCSERRVPLAMAGTAWGWECEHEPHCPEHEDNQEAVVAFEVVDSYGGAEHLEAEAIWAASGRDDNAP
jgi:hypothetical protein